MTSRLIYKHKLPHTYTHTNTHIHTHTHTLAVAIVAVHAIGETLTVQL
jgi:hypothetical protein